MDQRDLRADSSAAPISATPGIVLRSNASLGGGAVDALHELVVQTLKHSLH